jgi:hypothetical protein
VLLRPWTNHWRPVLELVAKRYDVARTPYRRVLAATAPDEPSGHRPEQEHAARGPTALRRPLDLAVDQLERLRDRGGAWDTQARTVTG